MFGERLKKILESKNISQMQFAKELGLTPPAINRWCNNVTQPDYDTLVTIAEKLNVSIDYLLVTTDDFSNNQKWLFFLCLRGTNS